MYIQIYQMYVLITKDITYKLHLYAEVQGHHRKHVPLICLVNLFTISLLGVLYCQFM